MIVFHKFVVFLLWNNGFDGGIYLSQQMVNKEEILDCLDNRVSDYMPCFLKEMSSEAI